MSDKLTTRVVQVSNIAPTCSKDQLRTLFGYIGRVKELEMYPPEGADGAARVAYVEFDDTTTTGVALHLSSTVFIDRAIMIVPVMDGKFPDESTALTLTPSAVAGMLPGQPTWPANVVSQVTGLGANQVIMTNDPRLVSLGLPQYPPLPATTDPSKIEEIRRTVFISDLDQKVTPEMLLSFFSQTGEIKYIRMAGDENGPVRSAYIEFTDQRCIAQALSYNNVVFHGKTVSVKHATTSIIKPTPRSEASQREIDDAMKKVKEASKLISAAANSDRENSRSPSRKRSKSRGRSRSRSKSKSRKSRSRSKGRRRRSTSRPRKRSRSRRRSPRRSRSPRRRRSRSRGRDAPAAPPVSRDRRRSRTRSPVRKKRSRTRSKSRRRSRTPPKSYSRGRRSRSRGRRSRSRDKKDKPKERKKSKSMSPPTLVKEGSAPPEKAASPAKANERTPSPPKAKKRSPTPKKRSSRSRSPSRRKRRRHSRSTSRKRSRSRSGSRHRSRKDKKRSRSRDRKHDSKKKSSGTTSGRSSRDRDDKKKESSSSKSQVKRDYDEEEKGFASDRASDRVSDRGNSEEVAKSDDSPKDSQPPTLEKDTDHQAVDMDMSD